MTDLSLMQNSSLVISAIIRPGLEHLHQLLCNGEQLLLAFCTASSFRLALYCFHVLGTILMLVERFLDRPEDLKKMRKGKLIRGELSTMN